jgi:hypothetical protein
LDAKGTTGGKGTHLLPANTPVIVFSFPTRQNPMKKVYLFISPLPGTTLVHITSNATGGGKYNGKVVNPPTADISASTGATGTELGADGTTCLIVNLQELEKTTHDLDMSGSFVPVYFHGLYLRTNSDGTPVFTIDGTQWEDC